MLTIGDFNSFWGFLGHPVCKIICKYVKLQSGFCGYSNISRFPLYAISTQLCSTHLTITEYKQPESGALLRLNFRHDHVQN